MRGKKSFKCIYLDKKDIDLKTLIEKAAPLDIGAIAKELEINPMTAYGYTSSSKRYAKVKVPQVFIDKILAKIKERSGAAEKTNKKIKAI